MYPNYCSTSFGK